MKLEVRYENSTQKLEVNAEEMWTTLSLVDSEMATAEEREDIIQEEFNRQFNRPDYNNWHTFDRHRSTPPNLRDREDADVEVTEKYCSKREREAERIKTDEKFLQLLYSRMKPKQADLLVAVYLNGTSVKDYAARIGISPNAAAQRLVTAKKNFIRAFGMEVNNYKSRKRQK